ncbi:hypothetical protein [Vibrio owensii]|uniref:hypothetical protein n=1 Tax=Vibrio owensii TaxID=696485 RepID=UPI0018F212F6|nr:hypothetical protein [Vibrio owensii]
MRHIVFLFAIAISFPSLANKFEGLNVPPQTSYIKVEEVKSTNSLTSTYADTLQFDVDGIRIELSKEDKAKAKNWRLSHQDWAKYKYAMEYMPRGYWTPDLDPPIVLGNLATSEFERSRYAKIAMNLEIDRRKREVEFMNAGEAYLKQLSPQMGAPKKLEGLEFYLGEGKTKLRSLFINADECDSVCESFVRDAYAGVSHSTQLYIYVSSKRPITAQRWVADGLLSENDIARKDVKVVLDGQAKYKDYLGDGRMPFYVHQTDHDVKLKYSNER